MTALACCICSRGIQVERNVIGQLLIRNCALIVQQRGAQKNHQNETFCYRFIEHTINIVYCRDVLQDSSLFQLTEDGGGVLWLQPSQNWSSDESDTGWDACGYDDNVDNSNRFQDSVWEEPENWDDDSNSTFTAPNVCSITNTEVCWDNSNDGCKLWNGMDWGALEETGVEEDVEEEFSTNLHYRDNVTIPQESDDGSLSNDSDNNETDDLVWISDNS